MKNRSNDWQISSGIVSKSFVLCLLTFALLLLTPRLSPAQITTQRKSQTAARLAPPWRSSVPGRAAASSNPPAVLGNGTVGMIPLWTGTTPSGFSMLGDSSVTELAGRIGISTTNPTSKLTVVGMIETTLGGIKFPDGTIQTTAGAAPNQR